MQPKKLKYEMSNDVVNYILTALNRSQIVGSNVVQDAKNLLAVVTLLQTPLNREELEKDEYEALKSKFDAPKTEEKPKKK